MERLNERDTPHATPNIPGELFAINSIAVACSTADRNINKLPEGTSPTRQKAFLRETIFFHHFMSMIAVFYFLHHDLKSRDAYCDTMMAAISSGTPLPSNERLGLSPLTHFSDSDRRDAIQNCFFSTGNIAACLEQELYLGRKPSKSELKIMNLRTVRELTGWSSPSASPVQYFAAAFVARLISVLEIQSEKNFADFTRLSLYAMAESKAAFKLYIQLLGAEVVSG